MPPRDRIRTVAWRVYEVRSQDREKLDAALARDPVSRTSIQIRDAKLGWDFGQFRERRIRKVYRVLVLGEPRFSGERSIDHPVGRRGHGKRMAVPIGLWRGRESRTVYRVLKRGKRVSFLEVVPKTGRTHQIRVHLASAGLPVLGDALYGKSLPGRLQAPRPMLHAYKLGFFHPFKKEWMEFAAPAPRDWEQTWKVYKRR